MSLRAELEPSGTLTESAEYKFSFDRVQMKFESYRGIKVHVRYEIRVTIARVKDELNAITEAEEFFVWHPKEGTSFVDKPIKMEVGIEDCLHIEMEFTRSVFNLKDCLLGQVFFNLVRIKIKRMDLNIIRKETV